MIAITQDSSTRITSKVIISLILGWIGFGINFQAVYFDFPPYQACLLPGVVFPMVVSLAWGWRYGLLSATLGLGAQTGWFLKWPHGVWEPVITIPMLSLWIVWHGWCAERKKSGHFPAMNSYWVEIPFRICHTIVLYTLLRWAMHVDSPAGIPYGISLDYLHFSALAQGFNAYFVLLIADVALNLGLVRKLFGLRQRPGQITTGYVISAALLFGLLFWVIDGLVDYFKFREQLRFLIFKAPESILDSIILNVSSPDLFGRTAFVAVCLVGGLLVSHLLRKQLKGEAALRESEMRYRRLHETMRDAFVQFDMKGRIVDFNPAYQEITGHGDDDLRGMQQSRLTPAKWHDAEAEILRTQVTRTGRSDVYEKEYIHAEGKIFPVEVRTFLIQDDADIPIGMWSIVRDITQRKQTELEREKAMLALEKSNEDLKQFAYVASHDLQEPLRMVSSYTQLLEERYHSQLDDKAHKYIHYAVDGAARMQALIRDLLAFSRVETHAQEFKTVDAQRALGTAIVNLKSKIDETGALVLTDDLPPVQADETQLSLLLQNLINNAIKFQEKSKTPRIRISALRQLDAWRFSVQDNGIGIASKYKDKIFQVFQRLHTRREYPGTGIGLALCKRIIDRHGGQIWFESVPGEGTTFYFTIPETKKESENGRQAASETYRYLAGGR
jgi:PAS domain S-box-containing protein